MWEGRVALVVVVVVFVLLPASILVIGGFFKALFFVVETFSALFGQRTRARPSGASPGQAALAKGPFSRALVVVFWVAGVGIVVSVLGLVVVSGANPLSWFGLRKEVADGEEEQKGWQPPRILAREKKVVGLWRDVFRLDGSHCRVQHYMDLGESSGPDGPIVNGAPEVRRWVDLGRFFGGARRVSGPRPDVIFSPDGETVAVLGHTKRGSYMTRECTSRVHVFETRSESKVWGAEAGGEKERAKKAAVSRQGDKVAMLYDRPPMRHHLYEGRLSWESDYDTVCVWGFDGSEEGELLWYDTEVTFQGLVFSADGQVLITAGHGVRAYDSTNGERVEVLWHYAGNKPGYTNLRLSSDGRVLAAMRKAIIGDYDGYCVNFWDYKEDKSWLERDVEILPDNLAWAKEIALSDDGRLLAVFAREWLRVYDLKDKVKLLELEHREKRSADSLERSLSPRFMLFTPDASMVVVAHERQSEDRGELEIWRVSDGALLYSSKDLDQSLVPWWHLTSALFVGHETLLISSYRPETERYRVGGLANSEYCEFYVWAAELSELVAEYEKRRVR